MKMTGGKEDLEETALMLPKEETQEVSDTLHLRRRSLTWFHVVLLQTTFSTSGAVVSIPYAFGILGLVLGPILLALWIALILWTNLKVAKAAIACDAISFYDVGFYCGGKKGARAARAFQMINLIFFMPVVLNLCGGALQFLVDTATSESKSTLSCFGLWAFVIWSFLAIVLQFVRSFKSSVILSAVSVVIVFFKALVFLPYIFAKSTNPLASTSAPASLFGSPSTSKQQWSVVSGALSCIPYAVTPIFILVEIIAEMKNPKEIYFALYTACALMFVLYIVPGVMGPSLWGWNINNPTTEDLANNWASIASNIALLYASMNDYVIAGITLFGEIQRILLPQLDLHSFSFPTNARWAMLTMPIMLFAFLAATLVPNITTLIGLLTSFTIVLSNTTVIACLLAVASSSATYRAIPYKKISYIFTAVFGVVLSFYLAAGAMDDIVQADYTSNVFCWS